MTDPAAPTPADLLRARLRADLQAAMKARQRDEVAALRLLMAAIDNAESVDDAAPTPPPSSAHVAGARAGVGAAETGRRRLTDADVQRIIEDELDERRAQAEHFDSLGHTDDAARLWSEAEVIARYRPAAR